MFPKWNRIEHQAKLIYPLYLESLVCNFRACFNFTPIELEVIHGKKSDNACKKKKWRVTGQTSYYFVFFPVLTWPTVFLSKFCLKSMEYKNLICYLVLKQDQNYLPKLKKKKRKILDLKGWKEKTRLNKSKISMCQLLLGISKDNQNIYHCIWM